ncbi:MAG: uL30 family ribosomal protein [Nanoarchaeota archaeon]|nr:uL30 family ribosomal protein [Nanoarchaeota archaeon]
MTLKRIKKVPRTKYDGTKTVAVILVRGVIGSSPAVKNTLEKLNLERKNNCVLVKNTPSYMGMLFKVKDYITYGEVEAETVTKLQIKRGVKDKEGKLKSYFRLNPPRGGFERKGIKKAYSIGGALGYRGKEMALLINKML